MEEMTEAGSSEKTIGQYVAEDFRTAKVFEKYGIDFCCGGNVPFTATCREKGLDPAVLLQEIQAATAEPLERSHNYVAWKVPFLADYIINTHHQYIRDEMNGIVAYARKIAEVHGSKHPEVIQIAAMFADIARDMMAHLREEEEVLFPAVRRLDEAKKNGSEPAPTDRELIRKTLARLNQDHQDVGDAIHRVRDLANDYTIPDDVCNTFALTYNKLKEFEENLHQHVHLENNILFPKAALM